MSLQLNQLSSNATNVLKLYKQEKTAQAGKWFGRKVYIISDTSNPNKPMFKVVTKSAWAFGARPKCSSNESVNREQVIKALTGRIEQRSVRNCNSKAVIAALKMLGKVTDNDTLKNTAAPSRPEKIHGNKFSPSAAKIVQDHHKRCTNAALTAIKAVTTSSINKHLIDARKDLTTRKFDTDHELMKQYKKFSRPNYIQSLKKAPDLEKALETMRDFRRTINSRLTVEVASKAGEAQRLNGHRQGIIDREEADSHLSPHERFMNTRMQEIDESNRKSSQPSQEPNFDPELKVGSTVNDVFDFFD